MHFYVTRECFVREKTVRVQGKVLVVYLNFLYCFQCCVYVKIFAVRVLEW